MKARDLGFTLFSLSSVFWGCATAQRTGRPMIPALPVQAEYPIQDASGTSGNEAEDEPSRSAAPSVFPIVENPKVKAWLEYFTGRDRERFQRFLSRGQTYRKVIEDVLLANDLPAELYYLALIESGYQNHAVSSAKATGVWQFMPATARGYGLQVDRFVDERRDPIRSTEAAAKYLRDLFNIFGSWPLAVAAYNAGEYRIIRAIVKSKTRDYWTLVKLKAIPSETADYVPKIMAAALAGADPDRYGLKTEEVEIYPDLEAVEIPSPIALIEITKSANLSLEKLRAVNPHLRGSETPANGKTYEVWLPKENATLIKEALPALASLVANRKVVSRTIAVARPSTNKTSHRVRAGENLSMLARRYGTTVRYLKQVISLKSEQIRPGQALRITSKTYQAERSVRYRVKRGESLMRIARRFGVTVKQIKTENSLRRDQIIPGQTLVIRRGRVSKI